jgi:intracellular sulfur oxidation DsrE/DsrF family protein
MKPAPMRLAIVASLLLAGCQTMTSMNSTPFTAVPGFGAPVAAPGAEMQVDPAVRYRVAFPATRAAATPRDTLPALERAARFLNLLSAAGKRTAPGDVVVVISGPATAAVLDDAAWRRRYPDGGGSNPNLPLIRALREAGATVSVCSQALHGQKIAAAEVDAAVRQDLSAMTTLAALQSQGYALIPE